VLGVEREQGQPAFALCPVFRSAIISWQRLTELDTTACRDYRLKDFTAVL
jgi:hypothetical protein